MYLQKDLPKTCMYFLISSKVRECIVYLRIDDTRYTIYEYEIFVYCVNKSNSSYID